MYLPASFGFIFALFWHQGLVIAGADRHDEWGMHHGSRSSESLVQVNTPHQADIPVECRVRNHITECSDWSGGSLAVK